MTELHPKTARPSGLYVSFTLDHASAYVLRRFALRLTLLSLWAFAGPAFGWPITFPGLTFASCVLCIVLALGGREAIERTKLNHWDEALGYLLSDLAWKVFMH